MTSWQKEISLPSHPRGFHLITHFIEDAMREAPKTEVGILQIFIKHTSASLTINENADPTVRKDFESFFNKNVPEDFPEFIHTYEGPDDMPAHIKSSMLGSSISIPVSHGRMNLGTWQGIYLCEHRNHGGSRRLVITLLGQ